jgi:hypothetical protein
MTIAIRSSSCRRHSPSCSTSHRAVGPRTTRLSSICPWHQRSSLTARSYLPRNLVSSICSTAQTWAASAVKRHPWPQGDDIDGGSAAVGTTVFVPCLTGIIAVGATESPAALHLLWSSGVRGGPPIVAAGLVWTIGQNGVLYGLNPSTGKVTKQVSIGLPANHFPTPSVGDGLFLVTSADQVVAFTARTSTTSTTSTPTSSTTSSTPTSPRHSAAGASPGGAGDSAAVIGAAAAAGVLIVGGAVWVLWRQRRGYSSKRIGDAAGRVTRS